jgi:hypothetical protein
LNKLNLPEPERVARLPHYKGIPITYTTLVDENGKPDFKSTDSDKVWEVKRDQKCSICGEHLDYWVAFMVTEKEAQTQLIYENPNHEECLRYAFQLCPWLYYAKATYSDLTKSSLEGYTFGHAHPDREISNERPSTLGIYITRSYKNVILPSRYRVCKVPAAKRIEWIKGN